MNNSIDVSIVMSIYNEKEVEVLKAVNSIINQSFTCFELIIVFDNPERDFSFLNEIINGDNRIKIIRNNHNMGLALSMNRAINESLGKYIVRMDADDIAKNDRVFREYSILNSGNYDVICSRFDYIDENDNYIHEFDVKSKYYEPCEIKSELPYRNVIHHPTTMFTKDIFIRSGGYRNFSCTQDYDLWLRMLYVEARFFMVNDILLDYRVRENSVSSERLVVQKYTVEYIRKLFIERISTGTDSFSESNLKNYLSKNIKNETKAKNKITKGNTLIIKGDSKSRLIQVFIKLFLFITNSVYRHLYYNVFVDKKKIKRILKDR